jgi:uncharacterized integral membrane protein
MRILRLLIIVPLLLLLVLFTLSNRAPLHLSLWPTDFTADPPASVVILGAMAVAFLAGAFVVWISELGRRRRAWQAEHSVKLLEDQVKALKAQLSPPNATPGR